MHFLEISTFSIYFFVLLMIALLSYRKQKSDADFVLGKRSLNFWVTALSAHASDMSNWLFMAYPALIFTTGLFSSWAAIGLCIGMYLNWQFVAPKIRRETEKTKSLTLNAYFESRFKDSSGVIRSLSSLITIFFFIVYISAGLVGLGVLSESLFGLNYTVGITFGLFIVVFYVYLGGYLTVAWIDLFQGLFLLAVILFIPTYLLFQIGGLAPVFHQLAEQKLSTSLFPDFSFKTMLGICSIAFGWGLGYFGQPQIITKFMGIRHVGEMYKAKYIGMIWLTLALGAATLLGLIGVYILPNGLADPQLVILEIVKTSLPAFFAGLVLCAILAATTNVMSAQILVVASNLSEDFYKRWIHKEASHLDVLKVSRYSVVFVAICAYFIAFFKISSINTLVLYAWSGIGSSIGPLVLSSLYLKKISKTAAIAGIFVGGLVSALTPLFGKIPPMIPGFFFSFLTILVFSYFSKEKALEKK